MVKNNTEHLNNTETQDEQLQELLRRAEEDSAHSSENDRRTKKHGVSEHAETDVFGELVNLADNVYALSDTTDSFKENIENLPVGLTEFDTTVTNSYDEDDIQVLEGLEAVRTRPGMYIGDTTLRGLHHLIYEIVANSVDEALAGRCDSIEVTVNPDQSVRVKDNGIGILLVSILKWGSRWKSCIRCCMQEANLEAAPISGSLWRRGRCQCVIGMDGGVVNRRKSYFIRLNAAKRLFLKVIETDKQRQRLLSGSEIFDETEIDFDAMITRYREMFS